MFYFNLNTNTLFALERSVILVKLEINQRKIGNDSSLCAVLGWHVCSLQLRSNSLKSQSAEHSTSLWGTVQNLYSYSRRRSNYFSLHTKDTARNSSLLSVMWTFQLFQASLTLYTGMLTPSMVRGISKMQSRQLKCPIVSTINVCDCFELYFGRFSFCAVLKIKCSCFVLLRLMFWYLPHFPIPPYILGQRESVCMLFLEEL